jgi:hypothetical protein
MPIRGIVLPAEPPHIARSGQFQNFFWTGRAGGWQLVRGSPAAASSWIGEAGKKRVNSPQ